MNCDKKIDFEKEFEVIDIEIEHLNVEKNSFIEFADRIDEIATDCISTSMNDANNNLVNSQNRDSIDRIKQIYSDTVLDVSHYQKIYDEPIEENMIHELGYDLYSAIKGSSSLTIYLKNSLITAAVDAASRRKKFSQVITKEKEYIREFEHSISDICEKFTSLRSNNLSIKNFSQRMDIYDGYEDLLENCDRLAIKRQKQIQSRKAVPSEFYNGDFEEYLYSDLSSQYPVLNLISEFIILLKQDIANLAVT